jgi:hypothetical protein
MKHLQLQRWECLQLLCQARFSLVEENNDSVFSALAASICDASAFARGHTTQRDELSNAMRVKLSAGKNTHFRRPAVMSDCRFRWMFSKWFIRKCCRYNVLPCVARADYRYLDVKHRQH